MTVRRKAFDVLKEIIDNGAYANIALKHASVHVSGNDINMLYSLVYNALDHRSYIEYILPYYCKLPKKQVRMVLLLGISELLFLSTPAHAVISETVELTKEIGKQEICGFVNAVMRRIDRERDSLPPLPSDSFERMTVLYGYPRFMVREWIDCFGEKNTLEILQFKNTDFQIRPQYPFTPENLVETINTPYRRGSHDPNCFYLEKAFDPGSNDLYLNGKIAIQSEGAMIVCRSVPDLRGKRVLDACAAPGGKTAYLSSLAENDLDLTAWEVHPHRFNLLNSTLSRLHVHAKTECKDASVQDMTYSRSFDRVLLDVPCSGFGLLADKPDLRYTKTEDSILSLIQLQQSILEACSDYVVSGGYLIYATCTISRRENSDQVNSFLRRHSDYTLVDDRQLLPFSDHTDGFYYAVLKRI